MKTLIFILAILSLSITACTPSKYRTTGLIFEVNDRETVSLIGYSGTDEHIIVPSTYNGLPVTNVSFKVIETNVSIKSIDLPESIIEIDMNALSNQVFSELDYFLVPKNLKYFALAFYYNNRHIKVVIPDDHTFLQTIVVNDVDLVVTKDNKELVYVPFTEDESKILQIPNGIEIIADGAAAYTNYGEIILPDTLQYIGDRAFINTFAHRHNKCSTLINLPNSIRHIGDYAFQGGYQVEHLVLPNNLESIGKLAFAFNNIKSLKINSKLSNFEGFVRDIPGEPRSNMISFIEFDSFNLRGQSLDNFIIYFIRTNLPYETITVKLPGNASEADFLITIINLSATIAQIHDPNAISLDFVFLHP